MPQKIQCLIFPDILPWEWAAVEPILNCLGAKYHIDKKELSESDRAYFRHQPASANSDIYWVFSKRWTEAARFLALSRAPGKVYFSLFSNAHLPAASFLKLFWRKLKPQVSSKVHLVAHSPLNNRFFREIISIPDQSISLLPLCAPKLEGTEEKMGVSPPVVGTFAPFFSESNLNYFLSVAHYVNQKNPSVRFRIMGSGPLYGHMVQTVRELSMEASVEVVETVDLSLVRDLDIFLYVPLRNEHFIPLCAAAACQLPTLTNDALGIEEYVQDGRNGFIVPVNEIKPMGELVIRLIENPGLRLGLGLEISKTVCEKFDGQTLAGYYEKLFSLAATDLSSEAA
ncbi:MAG: glycosyltransferase [Deltaproteobacteria bacterium]|nr:glycosyltransferase [Deltaproteobacteria bacterium]